MSQTPSRAWRPDLPGLLLRGLLMAALAAALGGCGRGGPAPPAREPAPASAAADGMTAEEMARMPASPSAANEIVVAPERLQAIGVKVEKIVRRTVVREIRTVGRVAIDERRLARVNLKVEGWVERLYVNTTGQEVNRGQELFTLYSPDLVAAQEEYLLALRNAGALGTSPFPDVAASARSVLEASRRRLELWDIGASQIHEIGRTGMALRALPIHAPLAGTVIEKMAVAGMRVMPGEDLYVIADLDHVWILADAYEYELPFVRVGDTARITLSYDPDAAMEARVTFIYPTLDPETRTARVRFELDNPGHRLKPDMYATVALAVPMGERLVVPRDAVLEAGQRRVMFISRGGGRLEWRNVRIGARADDWVEILEGISDGEQVVTSANFLLDSESQVKGAMAGMPGMEGVEEGRR